MPRQLKPRWVCNVCKTDVAEKGKNLQAAIREHRKTCPKVTVSLKQV